MGGFIESYKSYFELRNLILITYSPIAFLFTWDFFENNSVPYGRILSAFALIFLLAIFTLCTMELLYSKEINNSVYVFCIWIFGISIIIAIMRNDINVIVASVTLLLVVITAYSVTTTNQIARTQLKLQNNPTVILSVKENDDDLHIIDLIIENAGNGVARRIRFEINPYGFTTLSGDQIGQLYFFRNGIQILAPKQKYIIHLTNLVKKSVKFGNKIIFLYLTINSLLHKRKVYELF